MSLFFFQSEYVIRDLRRSWRLGDVYKQQVTASPTPRATYSPVLGPAPPGPDPVDPICERFSFEGKSPEVEKEDNILEVARGIPALSYAVGLFERAGLSRVFDCPGPFTAQIPVNSAITAMDPATLKYLTEPANMAELQNLMLYHILPGPYKTDTLPSGLLETLLPGRLVDVMAIPPTFNTVGVVTPNIPASNGYIHMIESVMRYRQRKFFVAIGHLFNLLFA